ncbi:MAG: glycoside hydrolase family 2 [Bacteroidales bacterium]|nr:glycoside hydrolase family 2 [Bacteroidales bacterium]
MIRKFILTCAALAASLIVTAKPQRADIRLSEGWFIQSSAEISLDGAQLSSKGTDFGDNWFKASVPSTVMGALTAENGLYADAFMGRNYAEIDRSKFENPWWYRTTFKTPALKKGQRAELNFEGLSYRADVWLNGELVVSAEDFYGPFRQFSFDVTDLLQKDNHLAVKVYRWEKGEFNIGFVDWNPRPADESMGIFRPVWLRFSNEVSMKNSAVKSKVNVETLDEAWLTVETTLCNKSDKEVSGKLCGQFDGRTFSYPVTLGAGETRVVSIGADDIKELYVKNPRLWWCHNLGTPEMYSMDLSFVAGGKESDNQTVDFGIRQLDSYFNEDGYRGFILNGKKVLVKGAGWTDDIFLRNSDERNAQEVAYVKDMNMNTIRFEEVWGTSQNIYDECDRQGVLALVGWSCHWEWEVYTGKPNDRNGCISSPEDIELIAQSWRDQILWLRNHPSIICWYAASDMLPRPALEQRYLDILAEIDDRPYTVHAGSAKSSLSGPAGMKMWGPYEWQAPYYWYSEEAKGNAVGFNTETGIGAQFPVYESLVKFIPEDQLWPVGDAYDYHTTTSRDALHDLSELKMVIDKRHGGATDLADFIRKAHFIDYEGTRAMVEAHRVNVPRSTGIIQWMLNSAWPSLYWQMYDWYLVPTSAYWSVKKGCTPQQLIYNYANNTVYAVNDEKADMSLTAEMTVYGLDGSVVGETSSAVEMPMGCSVPVFEVPAVEKVGFVFLTLTDASGNVVARNEYVLPEVKDKHDWTKYRWWRTQLESYADFSPLNGLAAADVEASMVRTAEGLEVTLENKSSVVAFFVRMALKDAEGEYVVPAYWSDNLVTLAPGQSLTFTCTADLPKGATVEVDGWNVAKTTL